MKPGTRVRSVAIGAKPALDGRVVSWDEETGYFVVRDDRDGTEWLRKLKELTRKPE